MNVSWDFTAGADATTGITSAAPDLLPVVYTTGQSVSYPKTSGSGLDLPFATRGPLGVQGMVVGYKNGSARFISAVPSGTGTVCPDFISKEFKDTSVYTQIKP